MNSNKTKSKKMNHFRKNRTAYSVLFLFILFLLGVFGLGFIYKMKGTSYDITVLGPKVANVNYITGASEQIRVTTPFIDGLVSTTVDLNDAEEGDSDYFYSNAYAFSLLEQKNPDLASEIENYLQPISYDIYDENTFEIVEEDVIPAGGQYFRFGAADSIQTNEDYTIFRFHLRQDGRWDTGQPVLASDFVFGLSKQIVPSNAAALSYILWDYSGINGTNQCYSTLGETDVETENPLFYGMTDTCISMFKEVSSLEEMNNYTTDFVNTNEGPGIIYMDDPINGSYIQFNLENSNEIFPSMTASSTYWPINFYWWGDAIGYDKNAYNFGYGSSTFSSNGPFTVDYFSSAYGLTAHKNEYYYASDLVSVDDLEYRVINEASTQVSVFNNGYASYIRPTDGNTKSISDNEEIKPYIRNQFTTPSTKYISFNLHKNNLNDAAKYYFDPNFRRAIFFAYNRTSYQILAGLSNTASSSIMTPSRMTNYNYQNSEGETELIDYVDLATNLSYTIDGQEEPLQLEYYTYEQREDILTDPNYKPEENIDPNLNIKLANYYWNQFLDDMNQLGITPPSSSNPVSLKFLTQTGDKDPTLKSLQESLQNKDLIFYDSIEIVPDTEPSGAFWSSYYDTNKDWDLVSINWSPDFLDAWAMLSIMNETSPDRTANSSGYWTVWTGSDFAFNEQLYSDPDLARELFNDGISSIYDQTTNINSVFKTGEYLDLNINEVKQYLNLVVGTTINDNGGNVVDGNVDQIEGFFETDNNLDRGIERSKHYELFDTQEKTMVFDLMFDLMIKNGASLIPVSNETSSAAPSKLILLGNPVIGYPIFTLAFDYQNLPKDSYWNDYWIEGGN